MNSILNIECSKFESSNAIAPVNVNLLTWLQNDQYLPLQRKVWDAEKLKDKTAKDLAKKRMPCITPSGVFSKRGKDFLTHHTGLIAIDIDLKDNIHASNFRDLKAEFCKIPNVAYCGLSVSGAGYWALIPITFPEKHEEHFRFIELYFKNKQLIIDPACKDVSRLRYYSYDPDAYFNHNAKPLQGVYTAPVVKLKEYNPKTFGSGIKPVWERYNESDQIFELLENHGWRIEFKKGPKTYFTRPGKSSGTSAEFDKEKNVFFVFTSESVFKASKAYNPFQVYTLLEHNGDFSKAAKALLPQRQNKAILAFMSIPQEIDPIPTNEPIQEEEAEIEKWLQWIQQNPDGGICHIEGKPYKISIKT